MYYLLSSTNVYLSIQRVNTPSIPNESDDYTIQNIKVHFRMIFPTSSSNLFTTIINMLFKPGTLLLAISTLLLFSSVQVKTVFKTNVISYVKNMETKAAIAETTFAFVAQPIALLLRITHKATFFSLICIQVLTVSKVMVYNIH